MSVKSHGPVDSLPDRHRRHRSVRVDAELQRVRPTRHRDASLHCYNSPAVSRRRARALYR